MSVLLLAVLKSNLDEGDNVRVALLLAFKFQQIVIGAARRGRKLAADQRPRVVDRTLACVLIQKRAGLTKQPVSFAAENSFFAGDLGKPLGRDFRRHAKMRRQPADITLRSLNAIVDRATVGDAIIAVILQRLAPFSRC